MDREESTIESTATAAAAANELRGHSPSLMRQTVKSRARSKVTLHSNGEILHGQLRRRFKQTFQWQPATSAF